MGFIDFASDAGMTSTYHEVYGDKRHIRVQVQADADREAVLDTWSRSHSYFVGYGPSQADVKCFQAIGGAPPDVQKYPHAYRWYTHIQSFEAEFFSLPGNSTKEYTAYGPEPSELTVDLPKESKNGKTVEKEEIETDDADNVDLFGSDDEEMDAEAEEMKAKRLAEYQMKKVGKAKPAAKTNVTLDVKPWDDETDMKALEEAARRLHKDGLVWGRSKLVPVGYGVKKLQINLVVEDEKVSLDELQEEINGFEDYVQSSDVAAMQKLYVEAESRFVSELEWLLQILVKRIEMLLHGIPA